MTTHHRAPDIEAIHLDPPPAPRWVSALLREGCDQREGDATGAGLRLRDAGEYLWLEWSIGDALELPDPEFRSAVARAYERLGAVLRERGSQPLRLWNFLPGIRRPSANGFTRYELFNTGRHAGYRSWWSAPMEGLLPASTAVGYSGKDCVVQVLARAEAGAPVENPRQQPAYRYSRRYGPVAPSFARAMLVRGPGGRCWAALSGTASIVGEDSQHPGDVRAQLAETLANLASVLAALTCRAGLAPPRDPLALCREIRAYLPQAQHVEGVREGVRLALPGLERLELARAELCRPELLVELEGRAELDADGGAARA